MISQPLTKKQMTSFFVFILIYMITYVTCFALTQRPNNSLRQNGDLTIDCAYIDQGYILAKMNKKTEKKVKMRVKIDNEELLYNINPDEEWETIPLQYGNGKYIFQLYKQVKGTQYSQEGSIEINIQMKDPKVALLCPNQYVNFNENSEAVKIANKICENITDQKKIYRKIRDYVIKNLRYDYIKALTIDRKGGDLPDIDTTCETHMGICQDISAVTVAMLRSQGVPSRLIIGKCGTRITHAWVIVIIDNKEILFDPVAEIMHTKCTTYTPERCY